MKYNLNNKKTLLFLGILSLSHCSHLKSKRISRNEKQEKNFGPKLKKPDLRKIWVEDKIIGNRFIEGLYE